ncbi:amino acid permease-associated region [Methanolacinia petrolearia DSM 11571]|uniref:Amino acid permease-associated region n=1 Tax=Methanolacinia petrolearia (strain DSM 11571 / OCM 486 / SEBR 4847) TaxID=679926 RepID=E1RF60_METP4|nr:amino acid permease [Methanolacinia petrolearia]ADN37304.1 amino acid permease-associated region [Methanolacinia petrolearia DSM 11571]
MSEETKTGKGVKKVYLGIFALAMINVAAVLSIRNFPSMAIYGWSCIGWYIIGTILFLIPISLAGAELATGWPEGGGVYAWVKQAFGERDGFIALFCEWSNNLVWFPTVLSFIAATLAFALTPNLTSSPLYMFTVMMIAFWGTTAVAYFGENASTKLSNFGVVLGSIIPAVVITLLGIWWFASGQQLVLPEFSLGEIAPEINLDTLPFFATVVLLFAGMEMAGFHALEVRNPQTDFPKAIGISAVIIFFCTIAATLAIAFVIPANQLSLASGVMQAIQYFFDSAGLSAFVGPMALLITIGGVVNLAAWLIGPAKGLGVIAEEGNMPPMFDRTNKYGAPVAVLVTQALIGSVISLLYVFLPSVNQAYWILSAMTVELLCIVYFLVFAALIKLRYSQPDKPRPFKIPGGMPGVWIVGGMGAVGVVFSFIVGLMPPSYYDNTIGYVVAVLFGTFVLAVPPLIFLKLKKPSWAKGANKEVAQDE